MGYSTDFTGHFTFDRLPETRVIQQLQALAGKAGHGLADNTVAPDAYCQWRLTQDWMGLEWDGNEKFYDYAEWLQYLIDYVLTPAGITLAGTVEYRGEEVKDAGTLTIVDGQVIKVPAVFVSGETLADLQAFKQFVLDSDAGDDLLRDWQRLQRARTR